MRIIKILCLSVIAVLSGLAAGASPAPAQQGELDVLDYPTYTTFTMFGSSTNCARTLYTGHKYNETPHQSISSGSTTFTVTPHYGDCTSNGLPMTIEMNGCDYVFHIDKTLESEEAYGLSTDIVCPVGKQMQMQFFSSTAESLKLCTLAIKPQTGLSGLELSASNGHLNVGASLNGLHVGKSGLCGAATSSEVQEDLSFTLEGMDEEGNPTEISISDEGSQGMLTSDGPVTLRALSGTAMLNGTQTGGEGSNSLSAFGTEMKCPESTYTGSNYNVASLQTLKPGATTITITPTFVNCTTKFSEGTLPVTVNMNGCDYVVHISNTVTSSNTYAMTTDIACPSGKAIQVEVFGSHPGGARVCTMSIKAQTSLSGAHITSTPVAEDFDISGTVKKIHIEKDIGLCEKAETTAVGEVDLDLTFNGVNEVQDPTPVGIAD